jgi:uncharacterized phage protein (TIGR01671 family)
MIPKFRAWMKQYEKMDNDIGEMYFEDGEFKYIGDDVHYKRLPEHVILMQSTGLKDKKGKEIFEGDILIVKDDHSWLEVVSYSKEKAMFVTEEINRKFKIPKTPLYDLFDTSIFDFEIIGNIYENKELLNA